MKVYFGRYPGKRAKNQERKIRVRIDYHDVWSLDNTLAHIIHPALVMLKEKKHGAPHVDDADVPEELRSTSPKLEPKRNEWDTDGNHFLRWDWVLDEMIWAFGQETTDWEDQFYSGEADIDWVKIEEGMHKGLFEMVRGPKDTFQWDKEGHDAHSKRMQNGFRLFGKYYSALWD